jgi:hypothetical protein
MPSTDMPRFVYKYQSPTDQNISNLRERSLWCSHPSKFNDPFDCAEAMFWNRPREVISDLYYDFFSNADDVQMMEHALEIVVAERECDDKEEFSPADTFVHNRLAQSKGTICFSELRSHLLMWAHYAQGHTGFCLEFDTAVEPLKQDLRKVTYQTKMPVHEVKLRDDGARVDVASFLLVKAKEWKYEKEWRLLCDVVNAAVKYPREALTSVYLGAKISETTESQIRAIVDPAMTHVIKMRLAADKYKLIEAKK